MPHDMPGYLVKYTMRANDPAVSTPEMMRIPLPATDDELLAECDVTAFRSGGKGGQHVNKTSSAVRLTHRPTGIVVTCQDERSQYRNKMICLERLRQKIELRNYRPPKRVKTREPKRVKEQVLAAKAHQAAKKRFRSRIIRGRDTEE